MLVFFAVNDDSSRVLLSAGCIYCKDKSQGGEHQMIITKLVGGLGNQMFQYAAGLALAHPASNHT